MHEASDASTLTRGLEHDVRALDIGLGEQDRVAERDVHVRLGSKVQHAVYFELVQRLAHRLVVANVAFDELEVGQRLDIIEILDIGTIVEYVVDDNRALGVLLHHVHSHVAADKAGTTGKQDVLGLVGGASRYDRHERLAERSVDARLEQVADLLEQTRYRVLHVRNGVAESDELGGVETRGRSTLVVGHHLPRVARLHQRLVQLEYLVVRDHARVVEVERAGELLVGHVDKHGPQVVDDRDGDGRAVDALELDELDEQVLGIERRRRRIHDAQVEHVGVGGEQLLEHDAHAVVEGLVVVGRLVLNEATRAVHRMLLVILVDAF